MSSSTNGAAPREASWVAASAPASSANLGCAFDCAALALNLRQHARAALRADKTLAVTYSCDASNLVAQGILQFAIARGAEISGANVEIENEIPVGVGLGSSAAATVCGLLLGASLLGVEPSPEEILNLAAKIEGHPDNAAAAVHGGLVFAAVSEETGRVVCARALLPAGLRLLAIVPSTPTSTRAARAALPREYSRADVVHNLQRASLLAALCFSGDATLDPELFRDRIHQPYRVPSVPGLAECLAVTHPDLLGVCLSGSGSAALAFVRGSENEVGKLLAEPFAQCGAAATVLNLRCEPRGAHLEKVLANEVVIPAASFATEKSPCKS
jgi:homoserine kinase